MRHLVVALTVCSFYPVPSTATFSFQLYWALHWVWTSSFPPKLVCSIQYVHVPLLVAWSDLDLSDLEWEENWNAWRHHANWYHSPQHWLWHRSSHSLLHKKQFIFPQRRNSKLKSVLRQCMRQDKNWFRTANHYLSSCSGCAHRQNFGWHYCTRGIEEDDHWFSTNAEAWLSVLKDRRTANESLTAAMDYPKGQNEVRCRNLTWWKSRWDNGISNKGTEFQ